MRLRGKNDRTGSILGCGDMSPLSKRRHVRALQISRGGFLTSVQDLGRTGFREFGVSTSGALDTFALRVANLLVGNDQGAAGLEITLGGLQLRFDDERIVAWCGGDFDVHVGSTALPAGHAAFVPAGEELKFGRPRVGCRAWLAISGGIDVRSLEDSRDVLCEMEMFSRWLQVGSRPPSLTSLRPRLRRVEKLCRTSSPPKQGEFPLGLRRTAG